MVNGDESEENDNIELWKIKNLNRVLSSVRGNGTSMISLIIQVLVGYNIN
jgi:peptide subunit release factor 1 (eRF1)